MSHPNPHLDELTVPVYSPLHRRAWMITPRQFRVVCRINGQRRVTQRGLAEETGYSLHGLHRALHSLTSGGIVAQSTHRGRKGWTRLVQRSGAHLMKAHELNVPEQREGIGTKCERTTFGNILEVPPVVAARWLEGRVSPLPLSVS